jgi:hypothetical protein
MTDSSIDNLIVGKRVLFINGICSDIPSGGNTATQTLLRYLSSRCTIEIFSMAPNRDRESGVAFAIKSFPAGVFIVLYRYWRRRWLEFFSRFSPWLLVSMLLKYWLYRPDVLIFNHHCTFIFSYLYLSKKILVWHDVPSIKAGNVSASKSSYRSICVCLEQISIKSASQSWVLSFTEYKFLKRFYRLRPFIIPALDHKPHPRNKKVIDNTWLLVGNWSRIENCSGAIDFFLAYVELAFAVNIDLLGKFTIAGTGSSIFLEKLLQVDRRLKILEIQALNHYNSLSQFNQLALLAPINEGAGIKLKTLEAWSCDIPVIGTAQAFSGLSSGLWKFGGIKLESPNAMAKFCLNWKNSQTLVENLLPIKAYTDYLKTAMANDVR